MGATFVAYPQRHTHTHSFHTPYYIHEYRKKGFLEIQNLNYEKTMMLPVCMDVEIKEFKFSVFFFHFPLQNMGHFGVRILLFSNIV